MGGIRECYLHFENAGNQYLGRVVAGLDCYDYLLAVSPPYFNLSTDDELVERYYVGGAPYPPTLFVIHHYLFASLCYHTEFLSKKLHQKSKLCASPFFTMFRALQKSNFHGIQSTTDLHSLDCSLMCDCCQRLKD